jgi:hypothetical protein
MRPMSSFEAGVSDGAISLSGLLAGERGRAGDSEMTIEALAEEIARGGYDTGDPSISHRVSRRFRSSTSVNFVVHGEIW